MKTGNYTIHANPFASAQAAWDNASPDYDDADRLYDEAVKVNQAAIAEAIESWPLDKPWGKRLLRDVVASHGYNDCDEFDILIRAARGEDIQADAITWLKKAARSYGESEAS